ncbi:MAG TPA: MraY family glycosyltransferase [Acidimicrobiales bacterium]|jgi:UDP-GlcNAc:undecaprenyl-phosphate GlcNAc-1-phosphate transferase|nr:MraY family glycosyltransferase [Acidimicrobiales bacterium]
MTFGYFAVFGAALATTLVLTPVVRVLAARRQLLVAPSERSVHETPMPNIGGVAMVGGVMVGLLVAALLGDFKQVFESSTAPLGIAVAAVVIFLVGFLDDVRKVHGEGVSAPAKLAGMVLAGGILSLAGVSTIFFRVPFLGVFSLTPDLSSFLTVVWVVGMANAINLIDGLDGLAAGITAIAAGSFFVYGLRLDDVGVLASGNIGPLIAVITLAVCLGFLPYNFRPGRSHIIMGDSGALLLGLLMASSTIAVGGSTDASYSGSSFFFFAPLFIPLVILGVPMVDTAFAIVRRATKRAGVATADKEHLHHRLMRLGHGPRRSVLILWAWTALLSGLVLYPTYTGRGDAVVPVGILGLALLLFTIFHPGARQARNGDDKHDDAPLAGVGADQ